MAQTKTTLSNEQIEQFLQGSDPEKYIVAVESEYHTNNVTLVINDPAKPKYQRVAHYEPFIWFKEDVTKIMYGGNRMKIIEARDKYGVTIKKLRTHNDEGYVPPRMENGYKFIAKCSQSYNRLISFFKDGGIDVFDKENYKMFILFSPTEQFLIQSGKRLFKGIDDYSDLHRFQFDLETEGLFASKNAITQIGVRDNRGMEHILESIGNTLSDKRDSERENIAKFFRIIDIIKPDIIAGYNSENFDWPYLFDRAERLGMDITELAITLNRISKIKRKSATLKLGSEIEHYNQTHMYGYNILDISHAVRRAMAINSEIKSWGLKYITQYSEIAKPNRVYVAGDKISLIWADKVNQYAFNNTNGDWYKITEKANLKPNYVITTGAYIVQRYLCDDLWETEQIDNLFNQASFLISKILPTTFMRSSTMGTAGQWKLIMSAWSYQNGLAIPETQQKREFTGGLSRLLEIGYAKDVAKLDYAALYPKIQLTWGIFPDLDISGVMRGILTYVVDTRDHFKNLTGSEKKKANKLSDELKNNRSNMTPSEISEVEAKIAEYKSLSNLYDKKQLPLKILANSWFGSYGAPYIFNWGDTDSAEETTCRGRQALRLMVRHFTEKHGFKPLVGDTDGFNFAFPSNIDDIKYVARGSHWKTTKDAGKELIGLDAVLAEFNENYMEGRMGLDIDDICRSTINFARKNYANDINGKIKLVGNSIKSKKMPVFIEDFLAKAIRMLLDGDGQSFINYYYEYVDKIYNYQIPLVKMANKSRVKTTLSDYRKKASMKNKAGNPMPKQAHMELAILGGLNITLGDTLYYINTGNSKGQGDLKTIYHNRMTKKQLEKWYINNGQESTPPNVTKEVQLNCKLIDPAVVEHDFEIIKELELLKKALLAIDGDSDDDKVAIETRISEIETELHTDEYNVPKYLETFNNKVKPLLVCFNPEVRKNILLSIIKTKDKQTKIVTEKLKERTVYTKQECELVSGMPFNVGDQDSYADLMRMEDKEIKFWDKVDKLPNYMTQDEWDTIRSDYHNRMAKFRAESIEEEKNKLDYLFKRLEVKELSDVTNKGLLTIDIFIIADISTDGLGNLVSRKWGEVLAHVNDIFKYEEDAIRRDHYYNLTNNESVDRYDAWLDYTNQQLVMSGETINIDTDEITLVDATVVAKLLSEKANQGINTNKIKKVAEDDAEDDAENDAENDAEDDAVNDGINDGINDESIILEDEFDDTYAERPDGYEPIVTPTIEIVDDGWPF